MALFSYIYETCCDYASQSDTKILFLEEIGCSTLSLSRFFINQICIFLFAYTIHYGVLAAKFERFACH